MYASLTSFYPTQVKTKISEIKIQKNILKIGRSVIFFGSDVFIKGIKNKTNKEPSIASIPPVLWGIERSMA